MPTIKRLDLSRIPGTPARDKAIIGNSQMYLNDYKKSAASLPGGMTYKQYAKMRAAKDAAKAAKPKATVKPKSTTKPKPTTKPKSRR
jgi:hypothetical protein